MGLIDLGITKDEALAAGAQVPAGKFKAQYLGLLKDPETGSAVWTSQKGSKMLKASFKIIEHQDPFLNGKRLPIYNAVAMQFSLSDLLEAVPSIWGPNGPDDMEGIGTVVWVTVKKGKGDYEGQSQVSKVEKYS